MNVVVVTYVSPSDSRKGSSIYDIYKKSRPLLPIPLPHLQKQEMDLFFDDE